MKAIGWLGLALIAMALFSAFVVQSMVAMNRPRPAAELRRNAIMDVPVLTAREMSGIPKVENFEARDRSLIGYRHYQSKQASRVKLYLVHAETGDDLQLAALAGGVSSRLGLADVFTLDLRGHGQNPLHRGDIGYVGQPTNDLADLVAATSAPGDLVVVGGHSSGAAVAARLAAQPGRIKLGGLLLLAPIFSPDFAANKPEMAQWAVPLPWRTAALKLQNALGAHWSDQEIAVQYAVPENVWNGPLGYAVTSDYTWRYVKSLELKNADGSDLAQVKAPFLTIVGSEDEVIDAAKLQPAVTRFNKGGDYVTLPEETHFGIVNSQQTLAIIQNWMSKLH